jgi:hypothetical protein
MERLLEFVSELCENKRVSSHGGIQLLFDFKLIQLVLEVGKSDDVKCKSVEHALIDRLRSLVSFLV